MAHEVGRGDFWAKHSPSLCSWSCLDRLLPPAPGPHLQSAPKSVQSVSARVTMQVFTRTCWNMHVYKCMPPRVHMCGCMCVHDGAHVCEHMRLHVHLGVPSSACPWVCMCVGQMCV